MNLDFYFFNLINGFAGRWQQLDFVGMFFADYLGYILLLVLALFLSVNYKKYWKIVVLALAAAGLSKFIVGEIIRQLWFRSRPFIALNFAPLINQSPAEASFPSGHALFFFALATIVYLYNKKAGILFYIASFFIAVARVFVGVHWPSDVLAGAVLGILIAWILNKIFSLLALNVVKCARGGS